MPGIEKRVHQELRALHFHLSQIADCYEAAFLDYLELLLLALFPAEVEQINHGSVAEAQHRYQQLLIFMLVQLLGELVSCLFDDAPLGRL